MITSRDQDNNVASEWTPAEIAASVGRGDPEALAEALRPIAAGLADKARAVTDPRSVLLDLGHVVDSIRSAVAAIVADHELAERFDNDGDGDAPTATANIGLVAAGGSLHQLGTNI